MDEAETGASRHLTPMGWLGKLLGPEKWYQVQPIISDYGSGTVDRALRRTVGEPCEPHVLSNARPFSIQVSF